MELLPVGVDSSPLRLRSATTIKCSLHIASVLFIQSVAIDMKQFADFYISTAFDMCPVACLIIVLLLCVAVRCGIGIIDLWRNFDTDEEERGRKRMLVKLTLICALRRDSRLSSANKQYCLQTITRKQRVLFHGYLINMNAASVLTFAAATSTSSSDKYYMFLGSSTLLFIRSGWLLYQINNVYLRYMIHTSLQQSLNKDNERNGQPGKDRYHLRIQSLCHRVLDEMIHRKSNNKSKPSPNKFKRSTPSHANTGTASTADTATQDTGELASGQHDKTTSTPRNVTSRVKGRSNLQLRSWCSALFFLIFLPGVNAALSSQMELSTFVPIVGAVASTSYASHTEKKQDPLPEARIKVFWHAIDEYVKNNKMNKAEVVKQLDAKKTHNRQTLSNWFNEAAPPTWKWHVISQLLSRHEAWSKEWYADVKSIALSEFGPSEEEIQSYFEREHVEQEHAAHPPPAISPLSTDSFSAFSDSEQDEETLFTDQILFTDDGSLHPRVAARIISNLSRGTQLSKSERDLFEALQTKWKKLNGVPSNDRLKACREMACLMLRPKRWKQDRPTPCSCRTWTSIEEEVGTTGKRTRKRQDGLDLQAMLEAISRFDLNRAAHAIDFVLRKSKVLRERVRELTYDYDELEIKCQIADSIKQCLSHHTVSSGPRTKTSEDLVKHLVLGCVFTLEKNETITTHRIKNVLGTSAQQVDNAIKLAESLREHDEQVQEFTRAKRKDFIRDKLKPYIFNFCQDDQYTRVDTNQKPTCQVNPLLGSGEKVDVTSRIWLLPTLQDRYKCFIESEYYADFVAENGRSVGPTVFSDVLKEVGKFVSNATQRSCVDDVISNLEWAMIALKKIMSLEKVKRELGSFSDSQGGLSYMELMDALKAARYSHMVRSVCCDEHVYTDLPQDEKEEFLKLTHFECANGECPKCGVATKLDGILNRLQDIKEDLATTFEVMKWENAPRQGTNDKGKQNFQLELTSRQMEIDDLVHHFKECLAECIPHYHNIKWTEWARKHDINSLQDDECIILTDFGATTNLKATETVNSATDAHLVSCNAVVLSKRRKVTVNRPLEDGGVDSEDVIVFDVSYIHFLAETLTKGKKADHAMHKVCLDKIIDNMKTKGIKKFIYWTDNAPHQYKCRQTFIADASVADRHGDGLELIHRFAVVAQFKGPHDSAGKDVGQTLAKLEKKEIRSPNAYQAFKNLNEDLATGSTEWDSYEEDGDLKLRNKGVFGMNERLVFFVGETQEEVDRKKLEDPHLAEFMLVCDRTHTLDASDALPKTAGIHEIRSHQTARSK